MTFDIMTEEIFQKKKSNKKCITERSAGKQNMQASCLGQGKDAINDERSHNVLVPRARCRNRSYGTLTQEDNDNNVALARRVTHSIFPICIKLSTVVGKHEDSAEGMANIQVRRGYDETPITTAFFPSHTATLIHLR